MHKPLRQIAFMARQDFGERFPTDMSCRLKVYLDDGRIFEKEKRDYEVFFTRLMSCEQAVEKFEKLTPPHVDERLREISHTWLVKWRTWILPS